MAGGGRVGGGTLALKINGIIKSHECILSKRPGLGIKPCWFRSHQWSQAPNVISRPPATIKGRFAEICGKFWKGKTFTMTFSQRTAALFEHKTRESTRRLCSLHELLISTATHAAQTGLHESFVDTLYQRQAGWNRQSVAKFLPAGCECTHRLNYKASFIRAHKNSDEICQRVGGRDSPQKCSFFFLLCKWCGNSTWWCPVLNSWFIYWSSSRLRRSFM